MEIIGESFRPNENSHEFLFDISNSNIMKKELTISSKKIRFNFHADAEIISYENHSESSLHLDSIQESSNEYQSNKYSEDPKKRTPNNKTDLS